MTIGLHEPEHKIEEGDEEIKIIIVAPLSKPKEAALVLEKNIFTFDSPPYQLKLKLPHPVCNGFSQQSYDAETRTYKVKFKKSKVRVESSSDEEEEEFFDVSSTLPDNIQEGTKQHYGFANKYSNMFGNLYNEFSEVINLPNPDITPPEERRRLRIEDENEKWSDDHYLADTMETDHLESIFEYKPPWSISPIKDLNSDEKDILEQLKPSQIKDIAEEAMSEFQLVDILFSYAYNKRTTEGDNTVESGWTINKLSATLSWFEVFENLKTVLITCYKRALVYPLYRNWKLNQMVHEDVVNILKSGSKQIIKCLIEVRDIFNESDNQYVLNTLYINDLCCFAFNMTDERAEKLSEELKKVEIKKFEVHKDLPLLEIAAHITLEEESKTSETNQETDIMKIVNKIAQLNVSHKKSSSSEDDTESDSDESDSSESSSDSEN